MTMDFLWFRVEKKVDFLIILLPGHMEIPNIFAQA